MKDYIVTFRNKKTGAIINEVVVEYNQDVVLNKPAVLCLAALNKLKNNGGDIPKKRQSTWSWREF